MKKITTAIILISLLCTFTVSCGKTNNDTQSSTTEEEKTRAAEVSTTVEISIPVTTVPETTLPETTIPVVTEAFFGTAEEILDSVIAKAIELDAEPDYGIKSIECTDKPVTEDSCTTILGLSTEDFNTKIEFAIESKPNGSWYTHSVVIIKVKDGLDIPSLAEEIISKTKPNRFGCLKPSTIVGGYAGQYIFFTASSETSCEAVFAAVKALSAIEPVRIDRENTWSSSGGLIGSLIG